MASLQILADSNIPCVERAFRRFGSVHKRPGSEIGPKHLQGIDVLLVRSVTPVGPALLEGRDVNFVGSATIGTDHIDQEYLRSRGIHFAHAPGSNATSVADYVVLALVALARKKGVSLRNRTVGIIGCGNIGGRLARRLPAFGTSVLCNDPPRARAAEAEGQPHDFVPLGTIFDAAQIVTLHVPLTTQGPDPTHHLVDSEFLSKLNEGSWLLNTSRGGVVDGEALRAARLQGPLEAAVLDVWEQEPAPNPTLIRTVDVATPHIAGYAFDGKVRGTAMLYRALCRHLNVAPTWSFEETLKDESTDLLRCHPPDPRVSERAWLDHLGRQAYDIRTDDSLMRDLVDLSPGARAEAFSRFRSEYRRRRELRRHTVPQSAVPSEYAQEVEEGLTIRLEKRGDVFP